MALHFVIILANWGGGYHFVLDVINIVQILIMKIGAFFISYSVNLLSAK